MAEQRPKTREDVQPIPEGMVPLVRFAMRNLMVPIHNAIHRLSGGRLGKTFNGSPVCFVTMKGRKTGKLRTIPLIYIPHGEDVLLVASQGGMDVHPAWYRNLLANPDIEIEVGTEKRAMRARQASPAEKKELWPVCEAVYADFEEYQLRTDRDIPVMICSPR